MQTLAMDAEQSANNLTQQTPELLALFVDILTSVAVFVSGPITSTIADVVRKYNFVLCFHIVVLQ